MRKMSSFVVRSIELCTRYDWQVIILAAVLAIASSWYAACNFHVSTDINKLISDRLEWRQREQALEKAFPRNDLILAVIDAPTPELVGQASHALAQRLSRQKNLLSSIDEPGASRFFSQNGLLFLKMEELARQTDGLVQAKPLIEVLTKDPSLRGFCWLQPSARSRTQAAITSSRGLSTGSA